MEILGLAVIALCAWAWLAAARDRRMREEALRQYLKRLGL